jgi:hypothetical protein
LEIDGETYCSVTTGEDTSAAILQGVLKAFARCQVAEQAAA